jgi:chemotaxis protein histidine kinase CheA
MKKYLTLFFLIINFFTSINVFGQGDKKRDTLFFKLSALNSNVKPIEIKIIRNSNYLFNNKSFSSIDTLIKTIDSLISNSYNIEPQKDSINKLINTLTRKDTLFISISNLLHSNSPTDTTNNSKKTVDNSKGVGGVSFEGILKFIKEGGRLFFVLLIIACILLIFAFKFYRKEMKKIESNDIKDESENNKDEVKKVDSQEVALIKKMIIDKCKKSEIDVKSNSETIEILINVVFEKIKSLNTDLVAEEKNHINTEVENKQNKKKAESLKKELDDKTSECQNLKENKQKEIESEKKKIEARYEKDMKEYEELKKEKGKIDNELKETKINLNQTENNRQALENNLKNSKLVAEALLTKYFQPMKNDLDNNPDLNETEKLQMLLEALVKISFFSISNSKIILDRNWANYDKSIIDFLINNGKLNPTGETTMNVSYNSPDPLTYHVIKIFEKFGINKIDNILINGKKITY